METAKKSYEATQLLASYHTSEKYSVSDQFGMTGPNIQQRPLSYGQRAVLMEKYLSRETTFKSRQCITSSQFFQDLKSALFTNDDRAKLLEDYVQRRRSACPYESPTCSHQQASSRVESASVVDSNMKTWLQNHLRHLAP